MDNKLSELSKPYGYEYVTAGRGYVVMSRTLPPVDMREVIPLYSQEYVSALLAELEASKQYAKERDAENESLALTVGRLRAKLATPVRLPEREFDDWSDKQVCILAGRFNSGIDKSAEAIRAAGFKCEGDE